MRTDSRVTEPAEPRGAPGSMRTGLTSCVAALIGLGVSAYLSVEHYTASTSLACPETKTINCTKVTTSDWASVGPIPLVLLGLVFFAGMASLCSPPAWRYRSLDTVRVAGCALGVASALYLVWVEMFRVYATCLWCTAVHVATLVMLGAVLWTTSVLHDAD
jgi:uncharacterized membrane protein